MSRRWVRCLALAGATLLAGAASPALRAQAPPAPQPPPDAPAPAADAERIFQSAVANHLEAEKGGPDAQVRLRKAAAGYARVLELRPGALSALYNLGRAQQDLGDLDSAARSFALAASRPGRDQPFYLRQSADLLAEMGRWREASAAYERLVLLEPRLEEPHAILRARLLAEREANPEALLDYLWKLVASGQSSRAADLALAALEGRWPDHLQPELLSAVAAALGQVQRPVAETRKSEPLRRLEALRHLPSIGAGIDELILLFATPGSYAEPFDWWNEPYDGWAEMRGLPRRDAFRAAMRSLGDWYRGRAETGIATACYRAAVDLVRDPDPVALRRLASSYVEQGNLAAIDALAAEFADPAGELFAAKNLAYQQGKLEKILQYHQVLGQIYGALAQAGVKDWGDTATPSTALFQLDRAFTTAKRLDEEAAAPAGGDARKSHVDADLTVLLAEGLEAKAVKLEAAGAAAQAKSHRERALRVRVEAASKLDAGGDRRGVDKVLRGVETRELPPADRARIEVYRGATAAPPAPLREDGRRTAIQQPGPNFTRELSTITRDYKLDAKAYAAPAAGPRTVEVPATAEWFDSGIVLAAGQSLSITASGRWSNAGAPGKGPDGFPGYRHPGTIVADAPLAALVARVGDAAFYVGERFAGASPGAGTLFLAINDVAGTFGDNEGSLQVVVATE